MIHPSTLEFLKKLSRNNSKEWFDKNRPAYENAKQDFLSLVDQLIAGISSFDPTIKDNTSKEAIFRINRDIRFSKDKAPYKTNFGASMKRDGKKSPFAGYYIHVEPKKSFIGGGLWMPEPNNLKKVRQEIDYSFDAFQKIVEDKKFKAAFGELERDESFTLSRPPKDHDPNNPAIEFLKLKCFVATKYLTDEEVLDKKFVQQAIKDFQVLQHLLRFLNEAILDQ